MNSKISRKVILCEYCKGEGFTKSSIMVDYHKREYDTEKKECFVCSGTGRAIQVDLTYVLPFDVAVNISSFANDKGGWDIAIRDLNHGKT